jgi:hypothetical protein
MIRFVLSCAVLAACGGTPKPPPAKPDPRQLAANVFAVKTMMADIVHRRRGDCTNMAVELNTLSKTMRRQFAEVRKAAVDPDLSKQLTTEMNTYADRVGALDERIVGDLSTCRQDQDVLNVVREMPEL